MTQQSLPSIDPSCELKGQHHLLLLKGLVYLLPLSLLSGGVAVAQSSPVQPLPSFKQDESSSSVEPTQASDIPEKQSPLPDYESVPPLRLNEREAPASSQAQAKPQLKPIQPLVNNSSSSSQVPQVSSDPAKPHSQPSSAPTATPSPQQPQPTVKLEQRNSQPQPNPTIEAEKPQSNPTVREEEETKTVINKFIDLNGYPQTAENGLPTPRVELSDRAENCTTVIENGQLVSGSCNLSQQGNPSQQALVEIEKLPALPQNFQQPAASRQREVRSTYTPPQDLPKLKLPGNGDSELLFPLSKATAISSHYGWRLHPIFGNRRFHTGTDFIAPEGTPVVATKSGRVVLADYNSGYGLIVGLRHDEENESRYAHLSQIHVKPGQWVEQGTVIGRVGNTGLSTGPHLHFEWRIRKGSRWIAVDAREQLLAARGAIDPSQIAFHTVGETNNHFSGGNFLAYLPEILASLPAEPASWVSLPELSFLKAGNFNQAYQRQAPLTNFAQRSNSVLVLPFSLPKVLASVFNWQPPQLFAQEDLQRIPKANQVSFQPESAPSPPSPEENHLAEEYADVSQVLSISRQRSLETLTPLDALGNLNFPAPSREASQEVSHQPQPVSSQQ